MSLFLKKSSTNQILNKLILENCLNFGRNPKLNNKKITHYISGTRQKTDIFSLYEMRYLLLKVYPLIHNLFLQARLNIKKKKKLFLNRKFNFEENFKKLPQQFWDLPSFQIFKNKFNKSLRSPTRPFIPKILFATTTPIYSQIVSSAAAKCNMPFHVNRWLSGSITAKSSYLNDFRKWATLTNSSQKKIHNSFRESFFKQKKNSNQQATNFQKYQSNKKPTLLIIPDVSNNEMIIKETNIKGIPVLGIVNSNCNTNIAYPIFSNDLSIYSIHFFCHFLSSLITKEIIQSKHRIYNVSKRTVSLSFPQANKNIFFWNSRIFHFCFRRKKQKIESSFSFKGRYFLDNTIIPKIKIKKDIKSKNQDYSRKKYKKLLIFPKLSTKRENQKRLSLTWKKNIRTKINLIKKTHYFNFSKIIHAIRLPQNKPTFRFWNQNKFYFSNALKFSQYTSLTFQFKRFVFKKLLRNRFKKERERLKAIKKKKIRILKIQIKKEIRKCQPSIENDDLLQKKHNNKK